MKTWNVTARWQGDMLCFAVEARTKGDAVLAAQKKAATAWRLSRSEEALVRVEFKG